MEDSKNLTLIAGSSRFHWRSRVERLVRSGGDVIESRAEAGARIRDVSGSKHQAIVGNLYLAVGVYLKDHPIGAVFVAPFDVVFLDLNVVEPDLLYISRERRSILTEQHVRGEPDLVVEVLSHGTRKTDEITKRKLYERFGVQEYWVIDPELEEIKAYRRSGGEFVRAADSSTEQHDRLTTPLLPDFSVGLADIFAPPL